MTPFPRTLAALPDHIDRTLTREPEATYLVKANLFSWHSERRLFALDLLRRGYFVSEVGDDLEVRTQLGAPGDHVDEEGTDFATSDEVGKP